MFEVGFSELLLIMALALLVLGPQKLPKVVAEVGRWMGRARAMARQFREQLEVEAAESQRPPPPAPTPAPTPTPVHTPTPTPAPTQTSTDDTVRPNIPADPRP
ncbi:MAG: Sec-independent protein translocase protein TatB [Xanthomonadales bacterium]|nr:Sec-independent protein translocase protein TatB [Xanthomonadales bacterium]